MTSTEATADGYENQFPSTIIEKLYLKTELADVYFVFDDGENRERIPAHKCLLAGGSDVFKAMFNGDLKEKGDVKITDASADAFKEFLQFFYRSKVNLTVENVFDVVNLCKKYYVAASQSISEKFMKDEITRCNDNVCSIYELAIYFDLEDLIRYCVSKIVVDTDAVFGSSSFLECDHSVLNHILKFNELSCSEVKVFHACMNWVKAKAKQEELTKELVQAHLGDLFYEIRFGSMKLEDFVDLTISYGKLFSMSEYQEIVQMIRLKDSQPKMFKKDCRQARVPQWNADKVIKCNRYTNGNYLNNQLLKSDEKTTFAANKPVLLGEIMFASFLVEEDDEPIEITMTICEISSDGATKVLYNGPNVQLSKDEDFITQLPKPIVIKPGFAYGIDVKNSSTKQVRYERYELEDKVQLPGSGIIIHFLGINKDRGVVDGLRFNLISE